MKTNVLIENSEHPEPYPWYFNVQGPLGYDAPGICHGHMATREEAEEVVAKIVQDAEELSLAELMDKYGTEWTHPDG